MSYSVDSEERLISVCDDDLSGCTDWYAGDVGLTPNDDLWDDHGAALYKVVNGVAVERTLEERMADWPQEPEPEATVDDYAEALARLGVEV